MRTVHVACLVALAFGTSVPASAASEPGRGPDAAAVSVDLPRDVPTAYASYRRRYGHGYGRRQAAETNLKAATRAGYKPLSELTGGAYPAFTPGIGAVYGKREQMPSGPYLSFDQKGRQVGTIYKLGLDKLTEKASLEAGRTRMPPVDHVGGHFGGSHPGVDFPHYTLVFWHVSKKDEARVAK